MVEWPQNEADLARPVVAWLQSLRWEVYQEVEVGMGGKIADIVAVQGPLVWIIECKKSLSLAVLEQAHEWMGHAHYRAVAVPRTTRKVAGRNLAKKFLRDLGIGLLKSSHGGVESVSEVVKPKLNRRPVRLKTTLEHLHEAQKTWAEAGNSGGERWTPFKQTVENFKKFIEENPSCTMKEAIDNIDTHYSTPGEARASLFVWMRDGIIEGVELRDGQLFLV